MAAQTPPGLSVGLVRDEPAEWTEQNEILSKTMESRDLEINC